MRQQAVVVRRVVVQDQMSELRRKHKEELDDHVQTQNAAYQKVSSCTHYSAFTANTPTNTRHTRKHNRPGTQAPRKHNRPGTPQQTRHPGTQAHQTTQQITHDLLTIAIQSFIRSHLEHLCVSSTCVCLECPSQSFTQLFVPSSSSQFDGFWLFLDAEREASS